MSTKKMLINVQRAGHLRVAIVTGTQLEDFQVESTEAGLTRGNIYRGVVANVQPSLNAAFVDIGEDRHAFLPAADVVPAAYQRQPPEGERRPKVDQVMQRGKPIFVQVTKDGVGQKGPALNTNIALAGRYLVLTPFDEVRGISRKAEADAERKKARQRLGRLSPPEGCGVIVRTNGIEQNQTTLNRDLNALLRLWKRVKDEGSKGRGPRLLYSDQDLVVQALRDYLDNSIEHVVVDDDEVYEKAQNYMRAFMPRSKTRLARYQERQPLFSRYNLETQIDSIYERRAQLPGGGSLVIDSTEALTAIDVNSGRATKTADYEESILNVNLEAAEQVGRQLRLRDIGGLVVVDFIDMRLSKHQRKLEKAMRDALKADRARTTVGRVSPNGLLEINRQRIKQALRSRTHRPCPTCQGVGSIASPEFAAMNVLGRLEARASTGLMEGAMVLLHPEVADAVQNGHRRELADLEQEFEMKIEIISSPTLTHSQDRIDWTHRPASAAPVAKKARPALDASDIAVAGRGRRRPEPDAEPETATEEKPKRRPRRRRKRGGQAKADNGEAARTEVAAAEAKPEAPAPRRRRRRPTRRRRKPSEDDATTREAKTRKAKTDSSEPDSPAPRKRRPPRRRRKPSDEPGVKAANSGGEDAQSPGAQAPEPRSRRPRRAPQRSRKPPVDKSPGVAAMASAAPPPPAAPSKATPAAPAKAAPAPPEKGGGSEGSAKLSSSESLLSKWTWWRRSSDDD